MSMQNEIQIAVSKIIANKYLIYAVNIRFTQYRGVFRTLSNIYDEAFMYMIDWVHNTDPQQLTENIEFIITLSQKKNDL